MNIIDVILCIPLLWAGYKGFSKGLIIELASLASLILGIFGGVYFSDYTAGYLSDKFEISTRYINIIAFSVTFILIVIGVIFIGKLAEKLAKVIAMGFFNKLGGLIFSVLKYAFILSIILLLINSFDTDESIMTKENKNNSVLYKPISVIAPTVIPKLKKCIIPVKNQFKDK